MSRAVLIAGSIVLAVAALGYGQSSSTILSEDFESGLGAWTAKVYNTGAANNNTPMIFTATDPLLYTNLNNPGSQSAGYSSNLNPWDDQQPQYLRRQMPGAVPAGTYDVTLELDVFVFYLSVPQPAGADLWGVGNRVYALFDERYNDPGWNYDGGSPAPGFRKSYWPGWNGTAEDWTYNGKWQHVVITQSVSTTTGNIELRLLMHEKHEGPQAVAWDNVQFTVKQGDTTVLSFSDDFESGLGNWEAITGLTGNANNDSPTMFTSTDPLLLLNTDNPGSASAGYSSSLVEVDSTRAAWLQRQFPGRLPAGTHHLRLEMDVYRYKDPTRTDPWGVGNRVHILSDDQYDDPIWNFDSGDPSPGFTLNFWSGWNDDLGEEDWSHNGVWQHVVVERDLITTTGDIEIRLLLHDKYPGDQAVAWDNINLSVVSPCNDPRYDADDDDDVDQEDFGVFQACFTGMDAAEIDNPDVCRCMNSDGDTSIDQVDLSAFELCALGPEIQALASCDDGLLPP